MKDKKKYLGNAFSLQMLNLEKAADVKVEPVTDKEVASATWESVIGHADTAAVVADRLGRAVPANRVNVSLRSGDVLYVAQLVGGRLPEGSTQLPEGFTLKFVKVTLG